MEFLLAMEKLAINSEESDEFCNSILSRFRNSTKDHHQHMCAVIGAMSQELKDQNLPLTPLAYFGATCSSLDRLSSSAESDPPPAHVVHALLTILSIVLPHTSRPILKKNSQYTSELLSRVLRFKCIAPGAVASGLKCISHLLIIGDKISWPSVSTTYGVLLGYLTHDSPKVRRQSHMCLRDVLLSFQGTSVLAPASEAIKNIFERCLLLAGGSNSNATEGPKAAQEVLYVLDALKDTLPLLSMNFSTIVLKHLKSLLELHQPLVTRHVTDSLNGLCLHPALEVSSEALLDVLCSLAVSLSANAISADEISFTARLLEVGMKKIYSLNRQICVVKLPVVFNALRDVLASEREEALNVAVEAFKGLIQACVDESLIRQGFDIFKTPNVDSRMSGPTIIEKVCATVESLLDYRYAAVWDMSFQVVSSLFDKLGEYSSYLLSGTLKSLAEMQNLPDADFPYRKQLHECVGSALGAMGPKTFLSLLPLKLNVEDLSKANVWLFPILKQYTVGAPLSCFTELILGEVKIAKQKSQMLDRQGRIYSSRSVDGLVYSLWSLLPSFCDFPLYTANSFKDLERALCSALRDEPDVRGIICTSLQNLIHQNMSMLEGKNDISDVKVSIPRQRAMACYTPQVAANNLSVLKASAHELLDVLPKILQSSEDERGLLQTTIREVASISDKKEVAGLFKTTMQKLLKVTQEAGKGERSQTSNSMQIDSSSKEKSLSLARAHLFDLAVSLLPGLDAREIDLLFVAIKPALKDFEGLIQKKAYKVLSIILKSSDGFISRKLQEVLNLMVEVLPLCHFSAKHHRLDCLYFLIVHVSKDESEKKRRDMIGSFLTEIILALKEVNRKTRNRAYDVLVQIGHACGSEVKDGKKENLHQFFNMVAGGLAGETPHMISATMKGLARLAYEFTDLVSAAYKILPSTFLLLQRKNREIIKANLGLLKVLVAKSHAEGLQMHLSSMVEGLLKWQDGTKNHFKAKVKLLLEMLVKKCGMDAVKAVMPEEHMKLLTNIRKAKERRERKLTSNSEEAKSLYSKATTSRISKWNHTKIFSEFGDEENENSHAEYKTVSGKQTKASLFNAKTSSLRLQRKRKAAKSLPGNLLDELEDEPLDLLNQHKTRSALRSVELVKRQADSEDEPVVDCDGRLIIQDEEGKKKPKGEVSFLQPDSDTRSHVSSWSQKVQKRRKTSDSGWAYTGNEYRSKKAAGGDVRRKDKLEPYAYWPLDRKMMSRRLEHRAAARKGMASVVKLTKRLEGKSVSSALSTKGLKLKRGGKKKSGTQRKTRG